MNKLVSIISPCYNGHDYLARFLDSILIQNYDNIEAILIDDGSTDDTYSILKLYVQKFRARGYQYRIIRQINSGQSEAINKGLKIFTGEYLTWLDSDDALFPDAIRKKVEYMESHKNVGLLISKIKVVEFGSFREIGEQKRILPNGKETFFRDLILGNNVFYTPGGYMVRSSMFKEAMPKDLQIEHPREIGQNFQLLLPISYKFPIGYLDEYTYYYSVRLNSHSHLKHSFEEQMRINEIISKKVLYHIADQIETNTIKNNDIKKLIDVRIAKYALITLLQYHRNDNVHKYINILKSNNCYDKEIKLLTLKIIHPYVSFILEIPLKIVRKIKRYIQKVLAMINLKY